MREGEGGKNRVIELGFEIFRGDICIVCLVVLNLP
jgi:hypothetical protein